MMKVTRAMIETQAGCGPGLDLFDLHHPSGEWEITPNSCAEFRDVAPWDWLADNTLSPVGKRRYLRGLIIQRDWYLTEREKIIAGCRTTGGLATDEMKRQMAHVEQLYGDSKAMAFSAAAAAENSNAV